MMMMMVKFLFCLLFSLLITITLLINQGKKEWSELKSLLGLKPIGRISLHSFKSGYQGPNRIPVLT